MFKIQLMYPKLKINVYFIFLNIGHLTFGITLVVLHYKSALKPVTKICIFNTDSQMKYTASIMLMFIAKPLLSK
jgi:hypothetical protein